MRDTSDGITRSYDIIIRENYGDISSCNKRQDIEKQIRPG
jgi:hypothetical protein